MAIEEFLTDRFGLSDRVAVVIGGSGVLGGAMAAGLGRAGARVAVAGRSPEKVEAATESLAAEGVDARGYVVDVGSRAEIEQLCADVVHDLRRVDILLNAPGINSPTPFLEIGDEEYERIMRVNLKGVVVACQAFGARMIEQGEGGSIINISSVSSGPPLSRVFTYSMSKAALNNITQNLAREWAPHGIRVNAIAPGFFPAEQNRKVLTPDRVEQITAHTPMQRFGEPDELVGATLLLASPTAGSFVTGAIIPVDGGFTAMTI
jgi:NAD(P)-dependent dehydrogenase (short-subunit alcohol dehydrogenase family)